MTTSATSAATAQPAHDPALDLLFERTVPDVRPELVWRAWTEPEMLKQWFTPAPWRTVECEIDLRPGGSFASVMAGPNGERHENVGCFLEIVPGRRLVWTSALGPGFRPIVRDAGDPSCASLLFTAVITIEPSGDGGTKYEARVIHGDPASARRHADMGFNDGWGAAFGQLVALMKRRG